MNQPGQFKGLTSAEVEESRRTHGNNSLELHEDRIFLNVVKEIVLEPMFIILLAACIIYFLMQQYQEGFIMLVAIFIVAGISLFQEYRSRNAVQALKKISAPHARVIRNGILTQVLTDDIVTGDLLQVEEGEIIAADGLIVSANDFTLNESILTGESFAVRKTADNISTVYKGTLVTSGSALISVTEVGLKTMFGKIGLSMKEIRSEKTPLQQQIKSFVKYMVWVGAGAFVIVVVVNYVKSGDFMHALMHGLTLAMSVIPEEIPVAFSTFQALGAFRLLKNQVIVKQPQFVEALGSATVICADKTGTLTQNKMSIAFIYDAQSGKSISTDNNADIPIEVLEYAMWSSEITPFDPMEKAIHSLYAATTMDDKRARFRQIHEYPVGGQPPMMTHIFNSPESGNIIAVKGATEGILRHTHLSPAAVLETEEQILAYARKGYRVLGVGKASWPDNNWPASQEDFSFEFLGLLAFSDPPKENIHQLTEQFLRAGIRLKMITGDYPETALAIADEIRLPHNGQVLTGKEILTLSKEQLLEKVKDTNIFARMFPEAKLKVIDALKENGEVVAMTGDGVNDGPALKAAHIGIAMGQRGSEVAKNAAALILTDDDLGHMIDAVALGRKIYDNLKKAIQYIVSIHIPIILIVTLPLLFGWAFTDIFTPVHVIFLELIMGPTCSIIYENEPMEPGTMSRPPRKMSTTFLSLRRLLVSLVQGAMITAACLGIGYYFMNEGASENSIRTLIFLTLLFSNIFLTLVNRSFEHSIFQTIRYKNNLVPLIIGLTLLFIAGLLFIPFLQQLFLLESLPVNQVLTAAAVALAGTCWIEVLKIFRNKQAVS